MGDEEDSSPPPSSLEKSNLPMLYYGLVIVGVAAVVLTIYKLIIVKWGSTRHNQSNQATNNSNGRSPNDDSAFQSYENSSVNLVSSFNYKKERRENSNQEEASEYYECAVCLSVFEDGEEVRKLPRCNHCFHVKCIDMWLYSHFDCPLCRAPVDLSATFHRRDDSLNSRVGLMESGIPVRSLL